jgi:hypothetical protein
MTNNLMTSLDLSLGNVGEFVRLPGSRQKPRVQHVLWVQKPVSELQNQCFPGEPFLPRN